MIDHTPQRGTHHRNHTDKALSESVSLSLSVPLLNMMMMMKPMLVLLSLYAFLGNSSFSLFINHAALAAFSYQIIIIESIFSISIRHHGFHLAAASAFCLLTFARSDDASRAIALNSHHYLSLFLFLTIFCLFSVAVCVSWCVLC